MKNLHGRRPTTPNTVRSLGLLIVAIGITVASIASGLAVGPASAQSQPFGGGNSGPSWWFDFFAPAPAVPAAPADTSTQSFDHVVTMGDSFASGVGLHRSEVDPRYDQESDKRHFLSASTTLGANACQRDAVNSHGGQLARHFNATHQMVACGGAETKHFAAQLELTEVPGTGQGTLFVVTIGGNDVRTGLGVTLADTLPSCLVVFGCHRSSANQVTNFEAIESRLRVTYESLLNQYPDATVRVMGYPEIMQRSPRCWSVFGLDRSEADWLDRNAATLDQVVQNAVAAVAGSTGADIAHVSVEAEFDDRGACQNSSQRFINARVSSTSLQRSYIGFLDRVVDFPFPSFATRNSFHPNQKGYDAFYRSVLRTLG